MSYTGSNGYTGSYTSPLSFSENKYGNNRNDGTATYAYGHYFYVNTTIANFTNAGIVLAAGGNKNQNGGSAIYILSTITKLCNYGHLLGGGGGGGGDYGGVGGAGGGGGGGGWGTVNVGSGGSLSTNIDGTNGARDGNGTSGSGGGGPGGKGGTSVGYSPSAYAGIGGSGGDGGKYSDRLYIVGKAAIPDRDGSQGGGGYGGGYGGGVSNGSYGGGGGGGGIGYDGAGDGGYGIHNLGTITTLYNSQGDTTVNYGPLFYGGALPTTKYYIRLNSSTYYGQLYCTGWAATTTDINYNKIDIDPASICKSNYFPNVLVGNCFTTCNGITTLNSGIQLSWSIFQSTDIIIGSIEYQSYYNYNSNNNPSYATYKSFDLVININYGQINADSLYLSGVLNNISVTDQTGSLTSSNVSLYAKYTIGSGVGFSVNSDQRIKKNIQPLSSVESFELVKSLQPDSYQYIDPTKGTIAKYGYLAQDVESVLPCVVNKHIGYIPNFFEIVTVDGTKIVLNEKTTESLIIGTKLQFYDTTDNTVLFRQVTEIINEKTFLINEAILEPVFLYGQEVEDYRSIDTDQINTVLLSALQETQKRLEQNQKKIDELREFYRE